MTDPAPLHRPFGRYELLTRFACGGMAEVHLARIHGAGGFARHLVIKRILPHLSDDPDFVEMFLNEGRIAARLSHPNVCHVYELGAVDGQLFLAMEYLDGLSWGELSPLIPRDGQLELRCAAAIVGQVCEGLRYAHELRDVDGTPTPVVHRDVSPQNLMITTDGVCKLLDFGVSKVLTEGSRTHTGQLKGKLPYMAPEQIRGEPVDQRADVFSMGVVLWEALTGERLFRRDSDYQIWRAVTEEDIPTVTSRVPGLPPAIDAVVGRALARDLAGRYPTIRAFAADLREVADARGGPLEPAALAAVMREHGAEPLAIRAHQVSHALGRPMKAVRPVVAEPPADAPPPGVSAAPSATRSVQLRERSVRLGGRRRRAWWIALGAVAMAGAGVAAALWTAGLDPPVLAIQVRADAAVATPDDAIAVAVAVPAVPGVPAVPAVPDDAAIAVPDDAVIAAPDDAVITVPDDAVVAALAVDGAVAPAPVPSDAGAAGGVAGREPPAGANGNRPARPRAGGKKPSDSAAAAAAEPGQYSVDSKPYATIFIDGKAHGETPLFKVPLAPGKHRIRAVREDGVVQQFTITIDPGELTSSGTLGW